jgi:hypothetical protein
MAKWLRISLRIAGVLIGLLVIFWLGAAWYINSHKQELLTTITMQLKQNLNGGTLHIDDMDPALLEGFPNVAISLKNVTLRDSLWDSHHHDLIKAKDLFVSVGLFPLISGNVNIKKLKIKDGTIYLFTDSLEYTNSSIFRSGDTSKHGKNPEISRFDLENVSFIIENKFKHKLFRFDVRDLSGQMDYSATGWDLQLKTKMKIVSMAFNTLKGSFLQNKTLKANLDLHYDNAKHLLEFPQQEVDIEGDDIGLKGSFSFAQKPPSFQLYITANDILFKKAIALLSPSISGKLKKIDIEKPIDITASLKGLMKYRDTPLVKVDYEVSNNTLHTGAADIEHCSFKGSFTNELVTGKGFNDQNSAVRVFGMKGDFSGIVFHADTIAVVDLKHPVLFAKLRSDFELKKINDLTSGETFRFDGGQASVNLLYQGLLEAGDTLEPYLKGFVNVSNASATYAPRGLSFTNTNMKLEFSGYDLIMRDLRARSGQSSISMQGSAKNFLSFFWRSPDRVLLDWHVSSPLINLDEFVVFLRKREGPPKTAAAPPKNKAGLLARQLNKVLDESSVRMTLNINRIVYRKFTAEHLNTIATLTPAGVELKSMSVDHAGGNLTASGTILQQGVGNNFALLVGINSVNIQQLFSAFENFGQDAITTQNLRGNLTAKVNASGRLDEKTKVVPKSIKANVSFAIQQGALVHFSPFEKVGKYVFRKRNLSEVTFSRLENVIEMDGGKITISPMLIQSSAMNIHVEGVYNPPSGTDISIVVPLRNPKKDDISSGMELQEKDWKKGIIVYLRAQDGNDGHVKINWDPNKKGQKNKEEM